MVSSEVWAHGKASTAEASERMIVFPDIEGGSTLVSDLHMHSVFSDGHVWPRTRVEEALRDGLDAIAITEHLEWQPHLADVPHLDRNRAHAIAEAAAAGQDLMVIKGSEITRDWPVGHINVPTQILCLASRRLKTLRILVPSMRQRHSTRQHPF